MHNGTEVVRNAEADGVHFDVLSLIVGLNVVQEHSDGTVPVDSHLFMPQAENVSDLVNRSTEL